MSKQANEKGKLWVSKETRPYRASILFLTCLSVFAMVFSLAFAYTVRYLINSASNKESKGLWIFSALLLSFLLLKIFFNVLFTFQNKTPFKNYFFISKTCILCVDSPVAASTAEIILVLISAEDAP